MPMIVGFDPGGTTGICMVRYDDEDGLEVHQMMQLLTKQDVYVFINSFLHTVQQTDDVLFVVERFQIAERTLKAGGDSSVAIRNTLDILGALDFIGFVYGIDVVLQTPGHGKSVGTDFNLVGVLGLDTPSHSVRHQYDAARHIVAYLLTSAEHSMVGWVRDAHKEAKSRCKKYLMTVLQTDT